MPRVTAAHEQAVRKRIIDAAISVFGELGYRRATVQDVVRRSGLSVGAVYNHFKSKEELFLEVCLCEAESEKAQLSSRLARMQSFAERLRAAADWGIDEVMGKDMSGVLTRAWANVDESPDLRRMLHDRRVEITAFARLLLAEAVAAGELPKWIDVDGLAGAFVSMMDGLAIEATSEGQAVPAEAHRQMDALIDLLLAAPPDKPDPKTGGRGGLVADRSVPAHPA